MHGRISTAAAEFVTAPQSDAIDLRHLQDFFFRRWKLILATTAIVAAVTFLALLAVTPRYTGTAQVLLDPRKEKIFGTENLPPELGLDSGHVDSQISIIRSINMLRRVVEKLNLTHRFPFIEIAVRGLPVRSSLGLTVPIALLGRADELIE